MSIKKKVKWDRVVILALAVIGAWCVFDNTWRLTKGISHSVIQTVKNHRWSTNLVSVGK